MKFGSVCSGIEAASMAWHLGSQWGPSLGWEPAWLAEVEPFPCAVLHHRLGAGKPHGEPYWLSDKELVNWRKSIAKNVPDGPLKNWGDMTMLPDLIRSGQAEAPDILCGGTPCQAFSVAGKRLSLEDLRGNLTLTFTEIANAIDDARSALGKLPCAVIWENVPGVLNTPDRAFGQFLERLAGHDGEPLVGNKVPRSGEILGPRRRVAWCVLDAQFFGVPQRRRRVWVVAFPAASEGGAVVWPDPSELLAIGRCLRGDTPSRRSAGQEAAADAGGAATAGDQANAIAVDFYNGTISETNQALSSAASDKNHTGGVITGSHWDDPRNAHPSLTKPNGGIAASAQEYNVVQNGIRRLLPVECERLMGFPDGWTQIPWNGKPADKCPDGGRYKACGNSWAVPVARWVGEQVEMARRGLL